MCRCGLRDGYERITDLHQRCNWKMQQLKIVHDRFHISQYVNETVDNVRGKENKQLAELPTISA
jgi:transposase